MLTGKLTAKATSYTDTITRNNISNEEWTYESEWEIYKRIPIMGASPYYVAPQSLTLTGTYGNYSLSNMFFEVYVYDNSNTEVLHISYKQWGSTVDLSSLDPVLLSDTDIAYRIKVIVINNNTPVDRVDIHGNIAISVLYDDYQEPEEPTDAPFELPYDWVQNTTNTIADEFVPFTTVTTPIDSDNVDDSIDEFKDFLEGVQEHETLATVFMGYVSELLRLKGVTAFLCFAICCITMITVFELSGGD